MKKLLFFSLILFISCSPKKAIVDTKNEIISKTECPKRGNCTFQLLKNKSLNINTDKYGVATYTLQDSKTKTTIIFDYNFKPKDDVQDADYRESLVFEIDNDTKDIHLSDTSLQNTKMLLGRFCYCNAFTGYYKVNSGHLDMKIENGKKEFSADFKIDGMPQTIKQIKFTVQ